MGLSVIILAAGEGSRMNSSKPKVLQTLAGKTLIRHVVDTVQNLKSDKIIVIHGHLGDQVANDIADDNIIWVQQKERLGTGHAVLQALPYIDAEDKVLILYGDVPLVSLGTLNHLIGMVKDNDLGILTSNVENSFGLGRILRNKFGEIEAIIEEKDASDIQKQITEINTGIYCVLAKHLNNWLPDLKNTNNQGEYYLTDIVSLAVDENVNVKGSLPVEKFEVFGINTRLQLAELERVWQAKIAENIMAEGVSLADPKRFDVRGYLVAGCDTWIDINVLIKGNVTIGKRCIIGANCILKNCTLEDDVKIKPNSIIDGALIKKGSSAGPYARVRPGTVLDENVKIGNFVEIKNSQIGAYSKINHLSYVGDSIVGEDCNLGAGVITCNYDGKNKYKTTIEDRVFIGSSCQLIAPITIESDSTIGAGSTITKDVSKGSLSVARSLQKNIQNWQRPLKK